MFKILHKKCLSGYMHVYNRLILGVYVLKLHAMNFVSKVYMLLHLFTHVCLPHTVCDIGPDVKCMLN